MFLNFLRCCGSATFNADPDRTFHFHSDPESDPDPTLSFTHVGKSGYFLYFYSQQCQSTLFQYFGQYIEIFWKKYSLALLFAERDPDPDWQALNADPDPAQ